jgi:hypothetical protein
MPHHNTVFHGLLKQISRARFDRLVDQFKTDHRVRRLSSWTHFVTLLYGQLAQVQSLRGLECVIASHGARLYHLGVEPVRRSTLCDANAHRAPELFEALFASLLPVATPAVIEAGIFLRLIDATVIQLNGNAPWACYRDQGSAIKAHVVYDPEAAVPTYFTITPALTNDVVEARKLLIEPGAIYVFDGGYYSFAWWLKLNEAQCRFVTRLKKNSPVTVIETRVPDGDNIVSDRVGSLSKRLSHSRRNLYDKPVREIVITIDNGKELRLVTNDLTSPATEIAQLYKTRWQIELFFKWVKQNLRIKAFYGTSLNAVRIQIAIAMIAYLMIRAANGKTTYGMQTLMKLVRTNLMHRKTIATLQKPPNQTHPPPNNQLFLAFT